MPDEIKTEVSPTGKAILPPAAVPYAVAVVGVAAIVAGAPELGLPFAIPVLALGIAKLVLLIGLLFGISSPGLRKQP